MKKKIFIDGKAGTTGLRIEERLSGREDVTLLSLPEELRKDKEARRKILNTADIVFLVILFATLTICTAKWVCKRTSQSKRATVKIYKRCYWV